MDLDVLNYATPTPHRRRPPANWPMWAGLGQCLAGWAGLLGGIALRGAEPRLSGWVAAAGGVVILCGLFAGLLAVIAGPRRLWATVALAFQAAPYVALFVVA